MFDFIIAFITSWEPCRTCTGSGWTSQGQCPTCRGQGRS
ncbi:DnaJ-class molecular chaperone [Actinomadura luteofluorescens]|uniref:DnaJ-class molecular chaperone n=1 Tax=Actinomadura luteofluorescens TaxID=46163 RepID=A0A7Y9JG96_9ACTN|nr:DnaJ-class molecular chaperone [Actinomadura luteofluorescens]